MAKARLDLDHDDLNKLSALLAKEWPVQMLARIHASAEVARAETAAEQQAAKKAERKRKRDERLKEQQQHG